MMEMLYLVHAVQLLPRRRQLLLVQRELHGAPLLVHLRER
jgi:hypothetical protein